MPPLKRSRHEADTAEAPAPTLLRCALGRLCDVTIVCEGKEFLAHKAVLAAGSAYLRALMLSAMKEGGASRISILEVEHGVFQAILEHLYKGECLPVQGNTRSFPSVITEV